MVVVSVYKVLGVTEHFHRSVVTSFDFQTGLCQLGKTYGKMIPFHG